MMGQFIVVENPASVVKIGNNTNYSVYPNPTSGIITIQGVNVNELKLVEVINMIGEKMKVPKFTTNVNDIKLNLTSLPKGMYLIKIFTTSGYDIVTTLKI
jgi:hypothetical protein